MLERQVYETVLNLLALSQILPYKALNKVKLNRVRLEIKGDVGKWLGYHYRQSFNKYSDPYSLDNLSSSLELAYVNLKARHNLNFTIGKQFVNFGGYEYYVHPGTRV